MAHFKAQHMPYRKTATEWEILGDLALRLHRKEEVFPLCLYQRLLLIESLGKRSISKITRPEILR